MREDFGQRFALFDAHSRIALTRQISSGPYRDLQQTITPDSAPFFMLYPPFTDLLDRLRLPPRLQ